MVGVSGQRNSCSHTIARHLRRIGRRGGLVHQERQIIGLVINTSAQHLY